LELKKLHSKILKRTEAAVAEEMMALCSKSSEYLDSDLSEVAECYKKVAESLGFNIDSLPLEAAQDLLKHCYTSGVEARLDGIPASKKSILQHAENTLELVDLGFAAILPTETTKVIIRHIAKCCAVRDIAWTKLNLEMDEEERVSSKQ